jgi:phosphoribosylanthranilate isomerase
MPTVDDLRAWCDAGFDAVQVHFPLETTEDVLAAWSAAIGRERLWLAPKLPPGVAFPEPILAHADTILWDTYAAGSFGGTGRTGDWAGFRAARLAHPGTTWILAGGLSPENTPAALQATGARVIDVNSGVELSPGVKDPAKLTAVAKAISSMAR